MHDKVTKKRRDPNQAAHGLFCFSHGGGTFGDPRASVLQTSIANSGGGVRRGKPGLTLPELQRCKQIQPPCCAWSFCYPNAAQEYSAFSLLSVTQACIYWANAITLLRNTLLINTYYGCNNYATAHRTLKKTGNKIRSVKISFLRFIFNHFIWFRLH